MGKAKTSGEVGPKLVGEQETESKYLQAEKP